MSSARSPSEEGWIGDGSAKPQIRGVTEDLQRRPHCVSEVYLSPGGGISYHSENISFASGSVLLYSRVLWSSLVLIIPHQLTCVDRRNYAHHLGVLYMLRHSHGYCTQHCSNSSSQKRSIQSDYYWCKDLQEWPVTTIHRHFPPSKSSPIPSRHPILHD